MSVGTYAGAEEAMVDLWVEAQIVAQAEALDAINPGLSGRIFSVVAPQGTPYPFIVYQCQSPPRDVRGVGVYRVMIDPLYVVKVVAQVMSYDPLAPVARVLDIALTSASGSAVADGRILASVRNAGFHMVEIEAGTQYRHLGGEYRIQAQS